MTVESIQQVAVLGLGTMGHGIAQTYATAGYRVLCYDEMAPARKSLHERVRENLRDFVQAGLLTSSSTDSILARIIVTDSEKEAVTDAQFITEAVREDLPAKQALFARIETMVSEDTILASNSSTYPISQSAIKMRLPQRAIVTHWFNPPHIVPTVEVVPGPFTGEATTQVALALMQRLGKLAVRINKEVPGFLVNRVQAALWREIWSLLDQGIANPEDIDAAISGSLGFRLAAIGPLEVNDFGGLDVHTTVFRNLAPHLCTETELPDVVRKLIEAGCYGTKSGQGFYSYTPDLIAKKRSLRDSRFLLLLKSFYQRHGG